MTEYFQSEQHGQVAFIDTLGAIRSELCQPRDIQIIDGPDSAQLREEIAIDIRRAQGASDIGISRNLKFGE